MSSTKYHGATISTTNHSNREFFLNQNNSRSEQKTGLDVLSNKGSCALETAEEKEERLRKFRKTEG